MKKTCKKHGVLKKQDITLVRSPRYKNGITYTCKICQIAYRKAYYKKNKKKIAAVNKKYYQKNKKKMDAYRRKYMREYMSKRNK